MQPKFYFKPTFDNIDDIDVLKNTVFPKSDLFSVSYMFRTSSEHFQNNEEKITLALFSRTFKCQLLFSSLINFKPKAEMFYE